MKNFAGRHRLAGFLLLILVVTVVSVILINGPWLKISQYTIIDGGETVTIQGDFDTVGQVLSVTEITMLPQDQVSPSISDAPDPQTPIMILRAKEVTLVMDGKIQTYWTVQSGLASFLDEAGITLQRNDLIFADEQQIPLNPLANAPLPGAFEIRHLTNVTIHDGQEVFNLQTQAQTVSEVLQEAGIAVNEADKVSPDLHVWLNPNAEIQVDRAIPYTIIADNQQFQTLSHSTETLTVLAEASLALIGQDFTIPGPDVELTAGDTIQVIRVTEDFLIEEESIPNESLWQGTDELELDQRSLLSTGAPGVMKRRWQIRYENGNEVSRELDDEWVAHEPINEIMGFGTRVVVRTLDTPEGPIEYSRVVRMKVTAYTAASAGKSPDDPGYGITASGVPAGTGVVAIDPTVVPFRSTLYVPGYGMAFAGDTGGGVKGRFIDLGYDDGELIAWSGYVDVYYLTPVPLAEQINYLIPTALP
jgi:uncharacterized protein YabE (DUF348 family)